MINLKFNQDSLDDNITQKLSIESITSMQQAPKWANAFGNEFINNPKKETDIIVDEGHNLTYEDVVIDIVKNYVGRNYIAANAERFNEHFDHIIAWHKSDKSEPMPILFIDYPEGYTKDFKDLVEAILPYAKLFEEAAYSSEKIKVTDSFKGLENHIGFTKNVSKEFLQSFLGIYIKNPGQRAAIFKKDEWENFDDEEKSLVLSRLQQARVNSGIIEFSDEELTFFAQEHVKGIKTYRELLQKGKDLKIFLPQRTESSLAKMRDRLDLEPLRETKDWSDSEKAKLQELKAEGKTAKQIAEILERSYKSVNRAISQFGFGDKAYTQYEGELAVEFEWAVANLKGWKQVGDYMNMLTGEELSKSAVADRASQAGLTLKYIAAGELDNIEKTVMEEEIEKGGTWEEIAKRIQYRLESMNHTKIRSWNTSQLYALASAQDIKKTPDTFILTNKEGSDRQDIIQMIQRGYKWGWSPARVARGINMLMKNFRNKGHLQATEDNVNFWKYRLEEEGVKNTVYDSRVRSTQVRYERALSFITHQDRIEEYAKMRKMQLRDFIKKEFKISGDYLNQLIGEFNIFIKKEQ